MSIVKINKTPEEIEFLIQLFRQPLPTVNIIKPRIPIACSAPVIAHTIYNDDYYFFKSSR